MTAADGVDGGRLEDIARWAVDHCPVSDALRRAVPTSVEISLAPGPV